MTQDRTILTARLSCSRIALSLALGAALLLPAAFAQQGPAKTETLSESAEIIVVTGAALPVAQDHIGAALTVIGMSVIETGGYTFVADVLRQAPGVSVNRTSSLGGLTQVRIRGAEGNHTLVLLDGIDISSASQGETDFSSILSGDIERIEVLRGPQSGLYGSNALAGVVNLVTRRTVDGHYVGASIEGGAFNTRQIQANGGVGDGLSYVSGGFHVLNTDGYDVSANDTPVGLGSRAGDAEGAKIATVYLRGGYAVSPAFRIDAISRYVSKQADLDGQSFSPPISGQTFDDPSEVTTHDFDVGGSATLNLIDDRWVTILSASRAAFDSEGVGYSFTANPTIAAAQLGSANGATAWRNRYLLQSSFVFGNDGFRSRFTGFVENKKEKFRNTRPAPGATLQTRDLNGVGAEYRLDLFDQVHLSAVYRHDDNDRFQDADTYSFAGAWAITLTGTRLHASLGTGITNPTFTEQFGFNPGSFVGNADLKPEEAQGWDAGVEQTFLGGRAMIDVTYFESTLESEITTVFGSAPLFLSTPINSAAESKRKGVEASFRLQPTDTIDLSGSYTWLDATEPAGIEVRRPENQAAFDGAWRIGGGPLQLVAGVTYNGEQSDTDFSTFLRRSMPDYTLIRLGASYRLSDDVEIYGRVENAADDAYEEVISSQGAPRAVYIGVRFRAGSAK